MNFKEHQEFAKNLSNPDYDCLEHWVPKLVTEVSELMDIFLNERAYGREVDWVHVLEECGDFAFYRANIYRVLQPGFEGLPETTTGGHRDNFCNAICCGVHAGLLLRNWSQDPEAYFPEDFFGPIEAIYQTLGVILSRAPNLYTWEDALDANQRKLLKRYPKGVFEATKANKRNLNAEHEALEG